MSQEIDFNGMMCDERYSMYLELMDDLRVVHMATPNGIHKWKMESEPIEEFTTWDKKHRQAYLVGYMDARTEMEYLYDFNAPDFQKCYELGWTHGESDGIVEHEEEIIID